MSVISAGRSREAGADDADANLDELWLATLQELVNRAAHEVKDALNGVSLNLEVIRSRVTRPDAPTVGLDLFAMTAAEQFELLASRAEALLFLARPAREPADVAVTLKHLASLLVPAAKAEGASLAVEGYWTSAPTAAPPRATRLALAAALLALMKERGAARCKVETDADTVVRFSHESATDWKIDPAIVSAITANGIRHTRSGTDLLLVFQALA